MNEEYLQIGEVISNQKISEIFKCGCMGGIRISNSKNLIVAIADYQSLVYKDEWHGNVLHFIAAGRKGDQDLNNYRNKAVVYSTVFSRKIHLFEKFSPNKNVYRGLVILKDYPTEVRDPLPKGNNRRIYKFKFQPIRKVIDESKYQSLENVEIVIEDYKEITNSYLSEEKISLLSPAILPSDKKLTLRNVTHGISDEESEFSENQNRIIDIAIWRAYAAVEVEVVLDVIEKTASKYQLEIAIPYYDLERGSIKAKFAILASAATILGGTATAIAKYPEAKQNFPILAGDLHKVLDEAKQVLNDQIINKVKNNLPKSKYKIDYPNFFIPVRQVKIKEIKEEIKKLI